MLARNSKRRLSGIIALVAVTALVLPAARLSAAAGEGAQEGIKVHGDWTIEIREPDGTLVTRHEFKNSLVPGTDGGGSVLARLLKGSIVVSDSIVVSEWIVGLKGAPAPCDQFDFSCSIVLPNSLFLGFQTLVIKLTGDGQGLELSGHVTAARASSINAVGTWAGTQNPTGSGTTSYRFTSTPLSPAIVVAVGQIIQVKVVITFK